MNDSTLAPAGTVLALLLSPWAATSAADGGVSDVKAFYREGQTFLTWREDDSTEGEWYRIYASRGPISLGNPDEAALIARIPEGSNHFGFFRNVDVSRHRTLEEIAGAKWYRAIQIEDDEDAGKQLPDGTGLFVRTIKEAGESYYAVTMERDGSPVGTLEAGVSSLAEPVRESVATPGAVLQQKLDDRYYVYAFFCDFDVWNPDGVEDNWDGYVHVFHIRAPDAERKDTAEPYPVSFRLHAYSAWQGWDIPYCFPATHVNVRMLDYHLTWWYGYSDALPAREDNSRIPPRAMIVNFTEQRVLQVARWIMTGPANFPYRIDPERVSVYGGSMGGTGTNFVGLRNGDIFAGAFGDKGINNWALPPERNTWAYNIAAIFGPQDRNDLTNEGVGVYDLLDLPRWVAERPERETPFLDTANGIIDLVIPFHSVRDYWKALERGKHPYAAAWDMVGHASRLGSGSPMDYRLMRRDEVALAFANASCNTPLNSGFRIYSTWAAMTETTLSIEPGQIKDAQGINVNGSFPPGLAGKTLVLGPSHVAETTFTIKSNTETELTIAEGDLLQYIPPLTGWDLHVLGQKIEREEGQAREPTEAERRARAESKKQRFLICDGEPRGTWNGRLAWSTSLQNFDPKRTEDDIVDEQRKLAICIRIGKNGHVGEWRGDSAIVDVTPRRCQRFRPGPGEEVHWENWDYSDVNDPRKVAEGSVRADKHGLVTVTGFAVGKGGWGNRLVLTR
ncbi:MAG: alpha/beta hydrolase family protein [Armatimonadota bacterium]